jgi:GNAT superfamily N-acetyltransferase
VSIIVRPARSEDVAAMSRVLTASITELCVADHGGDPEKIASWTANKTQEGVAGMLGQDGLAMFVAEWDGRVAAVGATTASGGIALNYVAPEGRFRGLSKALLAAMEADLTLRGFSLGRLEATKTARDFYLSQGWVEAAASGGNSACRAMSKVLVRRDGNGA